MKIERVCPVCQQEMKAHTSHGVEVDLCGKCGGLWLDAGEFDGLVGRQFELDSFESAFDSSARLPSKCRYCGISYSGGQVACEACRRSLGVSCPVDGRGMHIVSFGEIEFDRCSSCRGIWIDGFEREAMGTYAKKVQREASAFYVVPPSADDWSTESSWGGTAAGQDAGGDKAVPRSASQYGGPQRLDVECKGCKKSVNRYSAWAVGEDFWCPVCAERSDVREQLQGSMELQRQMHELSRKRRGPDTWDPYGTWGDALTPGQRSQWGYNFYIIDFFVTAIGRLFR